MKLALGSAFSSHLTHSSVRESGCRILGIAFSCRAVVIVALVVFP